MGIQGFSGWLETSSNPETMRMRVYYSQEYDIEQNKSIITFSSFQLWPSGNKPEIVAYPTGTFSVNGNVIVSEDYGMGHGVNTGMGTGYDWYTFGERGAKYSFQVNHNQDGTQAVKITGSFSFDNYNYSYMHFNGGSWNTVLTLATIPRASSISSVGNIELNSACLLKWVPNSPAFAYRIRFAIGNWSYTTDAISPGQTTEYTYRGYIIPMDVAYQLPKSVTGTMTATIYTYTNSACTTQLGSESSTTFTVTVPASIIPTISSAATTIDNSSNDVIRGWGVAVVGYTKVNLRSEARGSYGSTIVRFAISGGYVAAVTGSALNWTGDYIKSSDYKTFTIKAIDSRGRESAAVTTSAIYFHPYSSPQNVIIRAERSPKNEEKINIYAQWSISSVAGKNTAVYELKYKKKTFSGWTTYNGELKNGEADELSIDFDTASSYDFRLIVRDAIGNSSQQECMISTMDVLLDFRAGGKGLGVGKVCETDAMEVALPAKFLDTVSITVGNAEVSLADYIRGVMNGTYT